ncbi:Mur ligase domain-containing protein [Thermoflavimicrobium daqui]|nr:Mur ligase domain-containing protein [Thermoflavimicrobium daqui]
MKTYHLLGLEDDHMAALAQVLYDMGHRVQPWDYNVSVSTKKLLKDRGLNLIAPMEQVQNDDHMIVLENHEERAKLLLSKTKKSLKWYGYHQFMGELIQDFTSISVLGLKSKKMLSRLLSKVFNSFAPTSYLLSESIAKGGNKDVYFVFEGCEDPTYIKSYQPDFAVITNMDEQTEQFQHKKEMKKIFLQVAKQVKKRVVACGDDINTHILLTTGPVLFYGLGVNNDLVAKNVIDKEGSLSFDVYLDKQFLDRFELGWCDQQAVLHALAVISIALLEGFDLNQLKAALRSFSLFQV